MPNRDAADALGIRAAFANLASEERLSIETGPRVPYTLDGAGTVPGAPLVNVAHRAPEERKTHAEHRNE